MKPRVVFVPGILGSVLVDEDLSRDPAAAQDLCDRHLGAIVRALAYQFVNDPCDHDPSVVYGEFGMAHWLFNTDEWVRRMLAGNGIDRPWSTEGRTRVGLKVLEAGEARTWGLVNIKFDTVEIKLEPEDGPLPRVEPATTSIIDPYGDFLRGLADKVDLLVFPYDWRLSNAFNATLLAQKIRQRWWSGLRSEAVQQVVIPDEEKVTIIAHSMGGLISRFYIEADRCDVPYVANRRVRSTPLLGHRFVKQLITVATPHLGVPEAYLAGIGELDLEKATTSYWKLKWLRALTFDASRTVGGKPLHEGQLKTLMASVSSLIEMFPAYRFMPREQADKDGAPLLLDLDRDPQRIYRYFNEWLPSDGKAKRPNRQMMNLLSSDQTYWPWQIFASFRKKLVPPPCLDVWLKSKGVHYFVAGTDVHETLVGYNPDKNTEERKSRGGDSVVPWKSWSLYPWSDQKPSHLHWVSTGAKNVHNDLFRSEEVADMCSDIVSRPALFLKKFPGSNARPLFKVSEVQALVGAILLQRGFTTVASKDRRVISVITIRFADAGPDGVLPVETVGASGGALKRYVPNTISVEQRKTLVWSIDHKELGRRRFIAIRSRTVTWDNLTWGGVIFLPEADCQDFVEVLTWNLGDRGTIDNLVSNETHAEYQFADCFEDWRKHFRWGDRIRSVEIENKGGDAYSPCAQCLGDLRTMGRSLGGGRRHRIGELSWRTPYTGKAGPTYRSDLAKTESTGWDVDPTSRPPQR
jgi:hypothetical protein